MSASASNSHEPRTVLLKAIYHPEPGSNIEFGQGAIERNELWHREIEPCVWLILVPHPGNPHEWEVLLTRAVGNQAGVFTVKRASEEERRLVESGAITLQK